MLLSDFFKNSPEEMSLTIIVTPIGKANGNIAVICEGVCALTPSKQLRLRGSHVSTPKTYKTCVNKINNQLISNHGCTNLINFNTSLIAENKSLPTIYQTAILNKTFHR